MYDTSRDAPDDLWVSDPWADDESVREPMRPAARGTRRNPSREDKSVRRRMRRAGAQEENSMPSTQRSELLQRIASATMFDEQMKLVQALDELDQAERRTAALDREMDLADTSIREAMTPVISRTARGTSESDWLSTEVADDEFDHGRMVAQAALWYGRVPEIVLRDEQEFTEQARGMARHVAASLGTQAATAESVFVDYAAFLRSRTAASGIDQIQQTTAPDGVTEKATPLPPDVFDNFAPPVNDMNAGIVGTETSDRAPAIQQAVNGGGNSSPEVPGGHSETGNMTGPGAEPSLGGSTGGGEGGSSLAGEGPAGGSSSPERAGGHSDYADIPVEGGPAKQPEAEPAQEETEQTQQAGPAFPGRKKEAASGLQQVQQTTDVNNQTHTTPLPTTVAFPWLLDEGEQADGMTGQAHYDQGGEVSGGHQAHASRRVQADQWTQPHQFPQPNIANSPATTPPRNVQEAGSGAADAANPDAAPSFGDAHAAPAYTQSYTNAAPSAPAQNVPVSMGGDNGTGRMHPAFASRKVASKQEMSHPDFQRGYKYAARWKPGTPVVRPGSPELEAGIYAALTDLPSQRLAWLSVHASLSEVEPGLGERIARHRELTHKVAAAEVLPTDGTYLHVEAATGIDLETTNPSTSPSPTGDTPINGPGRPGPLAGQQDAAAPAGAAPYNGAEPLGQPVVPPSATAPQGTPVTIPDTGMASATNTGSGLSPTASSFRRRVQAGLLAEKKGQR
ncbi:hypothetical protein [Streptomyces sp. MH60]|uniref:hypothetical protein n=1 Tax=Streptomyces sp. MH60 TaxID=1940758 RepID=UPI000CEDD5B6|nr:hypothetical protein [Streptomyces sp. MH60]PPS89438.1 hypothetical protein BZZ08_01584 [Streptomyces sp. MH60]